MGFKDFFSGKEEDDKSSGESKLHCPKCQKQMIKKTRKDITIDKCMSCGGIWLDKGEIFKILKRLDEMKVTKSPKN